jgi:hypothetical protein
MAVKKTDKAANLAALYVTETVAGTIAYARFAFPFSIMDKVGLVISRLEYWFQGLAQLNSTGDSCSAALIAGTSIVSISNQADPQILDSVAISRFDFGAAASGVFWTTPIVKDFSQLSGGGILVAPSPLSIAVQSATAGGVMAVWVRAWYTYMDLSTDEYWELVESRRIISS